MSFESSYILSTYCTFILLSFMFQSAAWRLLALLHYYIKVYLFYTSFYVQGCSSVGSGSYFYVFIFPYLYNLDEQDQLFDKSSTNMLIDESSPL